MSAAWTPDSQTVLIDGRAPDASPATDNRELWLAPTTGGEPRRIQLGTPLKPGGFRVHPDGRRIAFVSGDNKEELWVLENFLATTPR
jgi:dipeptidyl aminopeptidase/acylaminoacyl peptidase